MCRHMGHEIQMYDSGCFKDVLYRREFTPHSIIQMNEYLSGHPLYSVAVHFDLAADWILVICSSLVSEVGSEEITLPTCTAIILPSSIIVYWTILSRTWSLKSASATFLYVQLLSGNMLDFLEVESR